MPSISYLSDLNTRLAGGLARMSPEVRARHVAYLRSTQNPDGGFADRQGGSDLYYTGFALRGLAVLDALGAADCARVAESLGASLTRQASVVDFFSLLYSCLLVQSAGGPNVLAGAPPDWPERVAGALESLRTPDGGYAKSASPTGEPLRAGSTYHTFLVALCYQLLGRDVPDPDGIVRFLAGRRREDGGYVEIAPMRRSGTNPTAAAVGLLQINAGLTPEIRQGVVNFLAEMPSLEGGLRANARAPLGDLLSTFTASWTLAQLDALDRLDGEAVRGYARALECPEGGFHGGLWDDGCDVEYTFYGLGVLALFSP
jgi:geranylgeranyl transferase type-2 subunit beta